LGFGFGYWVGYYTQNLNPKPKNFFNPNPKPKPKTQKYLYSNPKFFWAQTSGPSEKLHLLLFFVYKNLTLIYFQKFPKTFF
jgi:hypothetical protein